MRSQASRTPSHTDIRLASSSTRAPLDRLIVLTVLHEVHDSCNCRAGCFYQATHGIHVAHSTRQSVLTASVQRSSRRVEGVDFDLQAQGPAVRLSVDSAIQRTNFITIPCPAGVDRRLGHRSATMLCELCSSLLSCRRHTYARRLRPPEFELHRLAAMCRKSLPISSTGWPRFLQS